MTAWYNEIDPQAAEWLRELIRRNAIAPGVVNETSIENISPADIAGARRVHLFAGIGAWDYALQVAGWPTGWPVWTGSCPCQPWSKIGKLQRTGDSRELWPHMLRLLRECRPDVVFGEQVPNAIKHGWYDRMSADMEEIGYSVGAIVLGAHSAGAPHIRPRLYWVAIRCGVQTSPVLDHPNGEGLERQSRNEHDTQRQDRKITQRSGAAGHVAATGGQGDATQVGALPLLRGGILVQRPPDACERLQLRGGRPEQRNCIFDAWTNSDLRGFSVGGFRRVEPGVSPLVTRSASHVGRLRGYGNSIVPQTAAIVIASVIDLLAGQQFGNSATETIAGAV
jgi:DNA (cytosine-5)-methyltransferase 1